MADDTTQRAAHRFFIEHLQTLEPFTKEDVRAATSWSEASVDAYWSKQFKNILEQVDDTHYPHLSAVAPNRGRHIEGPFRVLDNGHGRDVSGESFRIRRFEIWGLFHLSC